MGIENDIAALAAELTSLSQRRAELSLVHQAELEPARAERVEALKRHIHSLAAEWRRASHLNGEKEVLLEELGRKHQELRLEQAPDLERVEERTGVKQAIASVSARLGKALTADLRPSIERARTEARKVMEGELRRLERLKDEAAQKARAGVSADLSELQSWQAAVDAWGRALGLTIPTPEQKLHAEAQARQKVKV